MKKNEIIKKLKNSLNLSSKWVDYDGITPDESTIKSAILFLNIIENNKLSMPRPIIFSDGEVGFIWENSTNNYVEIGFLHDNIDYLILFEGVNIHCQDAYIDEKNEELIKYIKKLIICK